MGHPVLPFPLPCSLLGAFGEVDAAEEAVAVVQPRVEVGGGCLLVLRGHGGGGRFSLGVDQFMESESLGIDSFAILYVNDLGIDTFLKESYCND